MSPTPAMGLTSSPQSYSLIIVDAYRPPYIPPQLTTREFFQTAYDHLEPEGVLAINVGRAAGDRRLIDDLTATIGSVFPSVLRGRYSQHVQFDHLCHPAAHHAG